jgi:hypothetical protein
VTIGTLEEMQWEILPHLASVLSWYQDIFTCSVHSKMPYEEKYSEPTTKFNILCKNGWMSNHKLSGKEHQEATRLMVTVFSGVGKIYRKIEINEVYKRFRFIFELHSYW